MESETLAIRRLLIYTGSLILGAVVVLYLGYGIAHLLASGAEHLYKADFSSGGK